MDTIIGIDLGTTNSGVCVIRDGKPEMLPDEDGQAILASVVGFDNQGQLLVGEAARNQAILAPERTVRSIKRKMGQDTTVTLGDQTFTPQEISAVILRTLKERASRVLGEEVSKAVITVPAFFSEMQREATRQAGELAGLDVVRIINEPTAAALVYQPNTDCGERLLVYDLGGGTFDVSIVQIEGGVVEVLSSYGDTQLGGDDFDELLLEHVCDQFQEKHGLDLRQLPAARSRVLQAVEEAKKALSFEPCATVSEEFVAEKEGGALHLNCEIRRSDYEEMIEPLLKKTIQCVDNALDDAKLHAKDIDKIVLVGGSSRTPLVHHMLEEQLQQTPHQEVDPDLCVAMGAAVQGGLIAGLDVGSVLVDITPHTLGIQCRSLLHGLPSVFCFAPIIPRNTPLPATRSDLFSTCVAGQQKAEINVFQGEDDDVRRNQPVGDFLLEGLDESAEAGNEILVRFELNLDGILIVTAVERVSGLEKQLTIDNAITQFRESGQEDARAKLDGIFGPPHDPAAPTTRHDDVPEETRQAIKDAIHLLNKAQQVVPTADPEDAEELKRMIEQMEEAIARRAVETIHECGPKLEDLVFYLQDA